MKHTIARTFGLSAFAFLLLLTAESCEKCKTCTRMDVCGFCRDNSGNTYSQECNVPYLEDYNMKVKYDSARVRCSAQGRNWYADTTYHSDMFTEICAQRAADMELQEIEMKDMGYKCVAK